MKIYKLLMSCLLTFSIMQCIAQNNFEKTFGGTNDDDPRTLVKSADGNFFIAGSTNSFGGISTLDGYVFKMDSSGQVLWSKTYDSFDDDFIEWLEPTNDSGFVACGYMFSQVKQKFKILVFKANKTGDITWQKQIELSDVARAYCIKQTNDGGYIICGEEDSSSADGNLLIFKMNSSGNLLWNKIYGLPVNAEAGNCIEQTTDSGFVICGTSRYGLNSSLITLLKTDSLGDLEWSKNYYNSNSSSSKSYVQRINEINDGYIISGSSFLVGQPLNNILLMKTDLNGAITWSKLFSTAAGDLGNDMNVLPENDGYVLCGYNSSPATGTTNAVVLKTDTQGVLQWSESYGNDSLDGDFYSCSSSSSSLFLAGSTYSLGSGGEDIFIVKRDSSSQSFLCNSYVPTFSDLQFPLIDNGSLNSYNLSFSALGVSITSSSGITTTDVCLNMGLTEQSAEEFVSVYPNPFISTCNIIIYNGETMDFELSDLRGRIICKQKITGSSSIETTDIFPGIYILKLENKSKIIFRKIIKE